MFGWLYEYIRWAHRLFGFLPIGSYTWPMTTCPRKRFWVTRSQFRRGILRAARQPMTTEPTQSQNQPTNHAVSFYAYWICCPVQRYLCFSFSKLVCMPTEFRPKALAWIYLLKCSLDKLSGCPMLWLISSGESFCLDLISWGHTKSQSSKLRPGFFFFRTCLARVSLRGVRIQIHAQHHFIARCHWWFGEHKHKAPLDPACLDHLKLKFRWTKI
jgi:hypothetical protein